MALSGFSKKKKVAKQAWKSFTEMLKSKVRHLEITATVRDSISHLLRVMSHRLIIPFKTRYLQNTIPRTHFYSYYNHGHNRRQPYRFLEFFSRLFAKKRCLRRHSGGNNRQIYQHQIQRLRQGPIRKDKKVLGRKMEKEEEEKGVHVITDSMEDAWRKVVAASPHLRVDERAAEFIYKFKEEMRMEKERSFLEFQERLIRSA